MHCKTETEFVGRTHNDTGLEIPAGTIDVFVVVQVDTGIAVAVTTTSDPVNTKTTVSEIVLPSFERMDETYVIKVA